MSKWNLLMIAPFSNGPSALLIVSYIHNGVKQFSNFTYLLFCHIFLKILKYINSFLVVVNSTVYLLGPTPYLRGSTIAVLFFLKSRKDSGFAGLIYDGIPTYLLRKFFLVNLAKNTISKSKWATLCPCSQGKKRGNTSFSIGRLMG